MIMMRGTSIPVVIPFGGTGQIDVIPVGEPDKVEDICCNSYWGTGQIAVIPV